MSLIGNLLWVIFGGGLVIFMEYVATGVALCCTIVGIPWGVQCFKLAVLGLIPFGREIVPPAEGTHGALGMVLNLVWLILGGIWICLTHLLFAGLCAITIIGLPFAVQHMKLARLALRPFGRSIA